LYLEFVHKQIHSGARCADHFCERFLRYLRKNFLLLVFLAIAGQKGNANRATLAVARKLVAYLVAINRRQENFLIVEKENRAVA
jgi:hypothetical protein